MQPNCISWGGHWLIQPKLLVCMTVCRHTQISKSMGFIWKAKSASNPQPVLSRPPLSQSEIYPKLVLSNPPYASKVKTDKNIPFKTIIFSQVEGYPKSGYQDTTTLPKWKLLKISPFGTTTLFQNEIYFKKTSSFKSTRPLQVEIAQNQSLWGQHTHAKSRSWDTWTMNLSHIITSKSAVPLDTSTREIMINKNLRCCWLWYLV